MPGWRWLAGVNVQKGQTVMINADVQAADFAALLCEEAYRLGAGEVVMRYSDERVSRPALSSSG